MTSVEVIRLSWYLQIGAEFSFAKKPMGHNVRTIRRRTIMTLTCLLERIRHPEKGLRWESMSKKEICGSNFLRKLVPPSQKKKPRKKSTQNKRVELLGMEEAKGFIGSYGTLSDSNMARLREFTEKARNYLQGMEDCIRNCFISSNPIKLPFCRLRVHATISSIRTRMRPCILRGNIANQWNIRAWSSVCSFECVPFHFWAAELIAWIQIWWGTW